RFSPEKGAHRAIEIARRAGVPLQLAAKIDPTQQDYFDTAVKPRLDDPLIEYVGEIGDAEKDAFLGDAAAFVFPIDWPEPFGVVLLEALAVGTPIIAFGRGSVPEIVENGITGFVVDDIEAAVAAIPKARALDRALVRRRFEERFTVERMTQDYLAVYE